MLESGASISNRKNGPREANLVHTLRGKELTFAAGHEVGKVKARG